MIKKILRIIPILAILFLLSTLSFGQNTGTSETESQKSLTAKEWDEDLTYLVKRLEIMHPNLYANVNKEKFNSFVDSLRKRSKNCDNFNMVAGIMELTAKIKDGHTSIDPSDDSGKQVSDLFSIYPVKTYLFPEGLYVISSLEKYSGIVGKKVIKIGNLPTDEVLEKITKYISADNLMGINKAIPHYWVVKNFLEYLEIKDKSPLLKITVEDQNGVKTEAELESEPLMECFPKLFLSTFPIKNDGISTAVDNCSTPIPLWLSHPEENYWFEKLPDNNAMYLRITSMQHKSDVNFLQFCKKLFSEIDEDEINSLIIDLRNNSGGQHFEMPLLKGIIDRPRIDKKGNLFLLTNRFTFSAAQHLATQLTRYTNVVILGEATSGKPNHYGNPKKFILPNSKLCIMCSIVFHQDSDYQDFSTTTEPDFFVPLTYADYKNNIDKVLEQTLAYNDYAGLQQNFVEKMSEAYKSGGLVELKKVYFSIKPNYSKFGFNMKNLLYNELDNRMVANRKSDEEYINYLKFVSQELPDFAVIYNDLASWSEAATNFEDMKKYLTKCLELNPANSIAKMQLELLELKENFNRTH
ncbi:MAG: S41 family peptidase [bacterium]